MSTTAIIAEMVAIGLFAFIWIGLLVFRLVVPVDECSVSLLADFGDWAAPITILIVLAAYQVGWLINGICYIVSDFIYVGSYKKRLLRQAQIDKSYKYVRTAVYQNASAQLLTELNVDRTVLRLSRTGVLNFLMIGIGIIVSPKINNYLAILPFVLSVTSLLQLFQRCSRYYHEIVDAYLGTK